MELSWGQGQVFKVKYALKAIEQYKTVFIEAKTAKCIPICALLLKQFLPGLKKGKIVKK